MKKRRELDALVNGKMGRKKPKKGQHELLRNDSESSEMEEFSIPQKTVVRKRQTSRICATCLMACGFFLLIACLVTLAGLVFVHVKLQKDVDRLQAQLNKVDSGKENELSAFQSTQDKLSKAVDKLQSGDTGVDVINKNISDINQQIKLLNATSENLKEHVRSLEKRIESMPELESLPADVQTLKETVATLGSNVATLTGNVDDLQKSKTDLTNRLDALDQEQSKEEGGRSAAAAAAQDTSDTQSAMISLKAFISDVEEWNKTLTSQMSQLMSHSQQHLVLIHDVDNKTQLLDNRLSLVELSSAAASSSETGQQSGRTQPDMQLIVQEAVSSVLEELKNFTKDERQSVDEAALQNITEQINRLAETVHNIQESDSQGTAMQGVSVDASTQMANLTQRFTELRAMLEHYRAIEDTDFQTINSTLTSVSERVSTLEAEDNELGGRILDIEVALEEHREDVQAPDTTTTPPAAAASSAQQSGTTTEALIQMDNVKTPQDLLSSFTKWDNNGDGYLQWGELSPILGPALGNRQGDLRTYDTNRDNRFTVEELAPAFGLDLSQTVPPTTKNKVPFIPEEATSAETRFKRQRRVIKTRDSWLDDLINSV